MAAQSPDISVQAAVLAAGRPAEAARAGATWKRLGLSFWLSAGWLALVTLSALFYPLLHFANPNLPDLANQAAGPGTDHVLGTDTLGRDMLSRLVAGARISLTVGYPSTLLRPTPPPPPALPPASFPRPPQ